MFTVKSSFIFVENFNFLQSIIFTPGDSFFFSNPSIYSIIFYCCQEKLFRKVINSSCPIAVFYSSRPFIFIVHFIEWVKCIICSHRQQKLTDSKIVFTSIAYMIDRENIIFTKKRAQ